LAEAYTFAANYQTFSMVIKEAQVAPFRTDSGEMTFEQVFKSHFKSLHAYACTILGEDLMAEEMVQNVFCRLWEKQDQLNIHGSTTAYLYRSVYNECLNYLKHKKVKAAYQAYASYQPQHDTDPAAKKILLSELEIRLNNAINDLPEQCRIIFQMSRFEELKYLEIADRLGLSVKTVENQMGKALKVLREKLSDYLPLLLLILLNL